VPPDLRDLNYGKFVEYGDPSTEQEMDYNSNNTEQLDVQGMTFLLNELNCIKGALMGQKIDEEG
jgi:UDP-glucose 4-epimerase